MFSLYRLNQEWEKIQHQANLEIQVAGQVGESSSDQLVLLGQGQSLNWSCSGPTFSPGEFVQLSLRIEQIERVQQGQWVAKAGGKVKKILSGQDGLRPNFNLIFNWSDFLNRIREIMGDLGLAEYFTPSLVPAAAMESSLEGFKTEFCLDDKTETVYLPTSPEFALKKALSQGWTDIFEIKKCFRNFEYSSRHSAEFYMLEWYRGFADLKRIEQDLQYLIEKLSCGRVKSEHFVKTTIAELFMEELSFKLTPETTRQELLDLCVSLGINQADLVDFDFLALFTTLMVHSIEPALEKKQSPCLIYNFPAQQGALAQINSEGWADRFELYWKGMELANAFNELLDPEEQLRRVIHENSLREQQGKEPHPVDEGLQKALKKGLPPTGGVALGLDRLFMIFNDITDIQQLPWAKGSILRP